MSNYGLYLGTQKVWIEYRSQREQIINLLEEAEVEFRKITPHNEPKLISKDLRAKQEMSVSLRTGTGEMLKRLRQLANNLGESAGKQRHAVLQNEVDEIEIRLNNMLDLLDVKVKQLGIKSEKWNCLSKKIDDMKAWMKEAQKELQQLAQMDMSPEERLSKTQDLQAQIDERLKILNRLEKEAENIANDEDEARDDLQAVVHEVDDLKGELVKLHEAVSVQTVQSAQVMQAWSDCKAGLQQVKPWIRDAELKLAMDFPCPMTLSDAKKSLHQLHEFFMQCQRQTAQLEQAAVQSRKIGKMSSAEDDVDAIKTKLIYVSSSASHQKDKMECLVSNWQKFDEDSGDFNQWLDRTESIVKKPIVCSQLSTEKLETVLSNLKGVTNEVSERQSQLIALSQKCDSVVQNLSPEGVCVLTAELSDMKERLASLISEVRVKMNHLSDTVVAR